MLPALEPTASHDQPSSTGKYHQEAIFSHQYSAVSLSLLLVIDGEVPKNAGEVSNTQQQIKVSHKVVSILIVVVI